VLFDLCNMLIALRRCCSAWNRRRPRWNDDRSSRMTGGDSIVDGFAMTSLGGVESLIEHRASIEGPGSPCPPGSRSGPCRDKRICCDLRSPIDRNFALPAVTDVPTRKPGFSALACRK
jgi:hypothetical protein